MATTATYTKTVSKNGVTMGTVQCVVSVLSQNALNNTSTIKITGKFARSGTLSATPTFGLKISGTKYNENKYAIGGSGSGTKEICSKTVTLTHNTNGSLSVSVEAYLTIGSITYSGVSFSGTYTASGTFSPNTIARGSTISSITPSVTADGTAAVSIALNRHSTSYSHSVAITFGSYSHTINNVATSTSYVIPQSWLNAIPNSVSGLATVSVTTLYQNTQIGNKATSQFTIAVPNSVIPSISSLTAALNDTLSPSNWGVYVQGKSKATISLAATGSYGSTITSYSISGGGYSGTASTLTTGILSSSGTITFTAKVTDSRGRMATNTVSITVNPYTLPSITGATSQRAISTGVLNDEGKYVRAVLNYTYASIAGKNTVSANVSYRRSGESSWSSAATISNETPKVIGGNAIDTNYTYEVRYRVSDAYVTVEYIDIVSTSLAAIEIYSDGKGISFGKAAEYSDLFDVAFPARFREGITSDIAIPISSGGTGATTLSEFIENLDISYANIGTVPVSSGGTGLTTLTSGSILTGNGTGNVLPVTPQNMRNTMGLGNTTSALPIANGGTGAASASAARTNLGVPFIQRGSTTANSSSARNITFSTEFSSVPHIFVSYSTTGANVSGDRGSLKVYNKTTAGFSVMIGGSGDSTARAIDWMAVGTN
ncbi:MAG: DUF859 domain-containing protein [Oscillospiraceae bacterium]|jgi:hypothetical protein|nr:DUF859 domain-containing protein [Oscillospiraceae bacterium]